MNPSPNAAPRLRNARGDGGRLREEIVVAATSLLKAGSAESVTLRAVAREAGITAPSIYRHFDGVDAILRAVVEATFDDFEATLRDAAVAATALERVRAISRAYLSFARERPEEYRLMFGGAWNAADLGPGEDAERVERAGIGLDTFRVLVDAIADCVEEGSSTSANPVSDATALWVGLHGLATLRRTTPLFPWPSDIERELVRTLVRVPSTVAF